MPRGPIRPPRLASLRASADAPTPERGGETFVADLKKAGASDEQAKKAQAELKGAIGRLRDDPTAATDVANEVASHPEVPAGRQRGGRGSETGHVVDPPGRAHLNGRGHLWVAGRFGRVASTCPDLLASDDPRIPFTHNARSSLRVRDGRHGSKPVRDRQTPRESRPIQVSQSLFPNCDKSSVEQTSESGKASCMLSSLVGWVLFGLVAGAIARGIHPGFDPMGYVGTILLGVMGSLLGGGIAYLLGYAASPNQGRGLDPVDHRGHRSALHRCVGGRSRRPTA